MSREFSHQRSGTGTKEWAEVNVNIQKGCSNNCKYCYQMAYDLSFGRIKMREEWKQETIDLTAVNKKWRKHDGIIMFPTAHDITPFNIDAAIVALRHMLVPGNNVLIVSKPRLDCVVALCEELKGFRDQILFRFTIGSVDWKLCSFWEPGAPEPHDRIAALSYARGTGFNTSVSMEPMLAGTDMALRTYRAVEQFVSDDIWIGKMNKMRDRVDVSDPLNLRSVEVIEHLQRDEEILRLVDTLAGEKKVRWKDSIQNVIKKHDAERSVAAS